MPLVSKFLCVELHPHNNQRIETEHGGREKQIEKNDWGAERWGRKKTEPFITMA
jgi:hypothetical protein